MAGAAGEMILNATDPEANQRGRDAASDLLGKYANTDNWNLKEYGKGDSFNTLGLLGKFGVDMFANTAYTLGGAFKSKLKNQAGRPGSAKSIRNPAGGKNYRASRIKGLISGS